VTGQDFWEAAANVRRFDPLDGDSYGPALVVPPGSTVHLSHPARLAGHWTMNGGRLTRDDGAVVVLCGYQVFVEGCLRIGGGS
jgi:hypothetical protein